MEEKAKIAVGIGEVDPVIEATHHEEGVHQHIHLFAVVVTQLELDLDHVLTQDHVLDHNYGRKKNSIFLNIYRVEQCKGRHFFY